METSNLKNRIVNFVDAFGDIEAGTVGSLNVEWQDGEPHEDFLKRLQERIDKLFETPEGITAAAEYFTQMLNDPTYFPDDGIEATGLRAEIFNTLLYKKAVIDELGTQLSAYVREHADTYEVMDNLDSGMTKDEYFERLAAESADSLKTYDGTAAVLQHLRNDIIEDPDLEGEANILIQNITRHTDFGRAIALAESYVKVLFECGDAQFINEMLDEDLPFTNRVKTISDSAKSLSEQYQGKFHITPEEAAMFLKCYAQQADTPEGRENMLANLSLFRDTVAAFHDDFSSKAESDRLTHEIRSLESKLRIMHETEAEYIARKASQILYAPQMFLDAVSDGLQDANTRNLLVAGLEQYVDFCIEDGHSSPARPQTFMLQTSENEIALLAKDLIQRVCGYEQSQLKEQHNWKGIMQNAVQVALFATIEPDAQRTYYKVGQFEALKTFEPRIDEQNQDRSRTTVKLFDCQELSATIEIERRFAGFQANVEFHDGGHWDNRQIVDVADTLAGFFKEPTFQNTFIYPERFKTVSISELKQSDWHEHAEAVMDEQSLAVCFDRVLPSLATCDNDFIFYNGSDLLEELSIRNSSIDTFVIPESEILVVQFTHDGNLIEADVPLTPDEKKALHEAVCEYEKQHPELDVD